MMSDIPPVGSLLGELSIGEVLVEFDGPKLFTCVNELGYEYLAVLVDEDDDVDTYLYAPIETSDLASTLRGLRPLRDAFVQPAEPHVWVVEREVETGVSSVHPMIASEIPEEWLPTAASRLPFTQTLHNRDTGRKDLSAEFVYGNYNALSFGLALQGGSEQNQHPVSRISAAVLGNPIWGKSLSPGDGVEFNPVEALRFMAAIWPNLAWEEKPQSLDLPMTSLHRLREVFQAKRSRLPSLMRQTYETTMESFYATHELSRMASETALPGLLIVRDGFYGWVLSDSAAHRFWLRDILPPLEELAGQLSTALVADGSSDSIDAVERWKTRFDRKAGQVLEMVTGLRGVDLEILLRESPEFESEFSSAAKDPALSELYAAARMAGSLTVAQTAQIIRAISSIPYTPSAELDRVTTEVVRAIADCTYTYDEGLEAARALRKVFDLGPTDRADPEKILANLGVPVHVLTIRGAGGLEAFATWGPRRGPAVFLNDEGRRAKTGKRVTLSHELCHLLLDRSGALPVVDVLRGRQNGSVEARARAFAAEFLLPQQTAGGDYGSSVGDVRKLAKRLARRYGVSLEIVAWNIRNSGVTISTEDRAILRAMISPAWRQNY